VSEGLSDERLSEIETRCADATPGPWVNRRLNGEFATTSIRSEATQRLRVVADRSEGIAGTAVAAVGLAAPRGQRIRDATFIAHARADVPDLLAEVRRLRALLAGRAEGR
jgi:hypothetical protein